MSENFTLGDFGAGGQRSRAGDTRIDIEQRAKEATAGEWEYLVHTESRIGWHIPDDTATLALHRGETGTTLKRGSRIVGTEDTLVAGLELAAAYMRDHPEGGSRWS